MNPAAPSSSDAPRYSIIVPAYNVSPYIGACLDSLLVEQAFDCEILVVNDGSTDDTQAVVERYADDPRLHIIDKTNGGLSEARNTGIDIARGEYFLFVDGDDWLEPDAIPRFDHALEDSPGADLLVFGFYEVYGETRRENRCTADFWQMTNSACNKLFHRRLFDSVRFDPGLWYEDLALVPCLFARARLPLTLDAILYNYRRDRDDSIMNSLDTERLYDLPVAALRCLERIHDDEVTGRIPPVEPRFGADWEEKFITIQIFIPGVLHRSRAIDDRSTRQRYIKEMMARLPDRSQIKLGTVAEKYGLKMGLGSLLYRGGHDRLAHLLLHDTGRLKQWLLARGGRKD